MKISVFGLGYVGVTTAACLSNAGHEVIGVDIVDEKVQAIEAGESPIVEERMDALVAKARTENRLRATTDPQTALDGADVAFVSVGTPSQDDGSLDTSSVRRAAADIGRVLESQAPQESPLLIVFRSTMLPGTTERELVPVLEEHSEREVGNGYDVAFQPEFMREGSAVYDFYHPPKIVVGERVPGVADLLWDLYDDQEAPRFTTSLAAAEAVKYADNAFHALKITFANEIGQILRAHDVDSREVMNIFRQDRKLNISPKYLRPGFAFGGSCLPKDLRALTHAARNESVESPVLDNILESNDRHIERALRRIVDHNPNRVGLVGLSFKPGTDDLRESPLVELSERLLGKGIDVQIFDPEVHTTKLMGSNKSYVERHLPHLSELLVEPLQDLESSDLIVVGHPVDEGVVEDWLDCDIHVLDLVGVSSRTTGARYEGFAW